jgi:hypothetical protein
MKPVMQWVSRNFKERSFRSYIMNAPYLFSGVFKVVKLVIDKRTQAKINICSKATNPLMFEHISRHQLEKRFGGELEIPKEGEFWPPRYRSDKIELFDGDGETL